MLDTTVATQQDSDESQQSSPTKLKMLESPEQFLPRFVETLDDSLLIFSADMEGRIRFVSRSVRRILGFEPAEVIGRNLNEFLTQSQVNDVLREGCWRQIQPGTSTRCSCEVSDRSGTPRRLQMHNAMVGEGNAAGLVSIATLEQRAASAMSPESEDGQRVLRLAEQLTDAERAVVELVVDGHMNKTMARQLGVAVRTIEARRARAMSKLNVRSLPELVQLWMFVRSARR